jgi:hypothetical protein
MISRRWVIVGGSSTLNQSDLTEMGCSPTRRKKKLREIKNFAFDENGKMFFRAAVL